jgi:predicted NBD/HSP70 family sugar kinase
MLLEHHGKMVTWESFASGKAIVKRFGKRAEDIHDAKTWKIISHDISLGLIDLIAVLQPEVIVFGGGVDIFFERFKEHLEDALKKYETPLTPIPPLIKAARPNEAVVYGCYDYAKSML